MCFEVLTAFCFLKAKQKCCLCIRLSVSYYFMIMADLIDAFVTLVILAWCYQSARNWQYSSNSSGFLGNFLSTGESKKVYKTPVLQSMLVLLAVGNLIPLSIKVIGHLIKLLGCRRLFTRKVLYITRLVAALQLFFIVILQATFSILMITDVAKISPSLMISSFEHIGAIDPSFKFVSIPEVDLTNYERLDLGLCTFCKPETCAVEYFSKEKGLLRRLNETQGA